MFAVKRAAFARQFATRTGVRLAPIGQEASARLREYSWPGNVRELQNVIERAVITTRDGTLNLDRALPITVAGGTGHPIPDLQGVMTARDLARLERENLRRALEATRWQIAGDSGAAKLLGLAPSTLASRIKALRIRRHR